MLLFLQKNSAAHSNRTVISERVPTSVARPDLYKRKSSTADADAGGGSAASAKGKAKTKTQQYYRVTVRDNGVGMYRFNFYSFNHYLY